MQEIRFWIYIIVLLVIILIGVVKFNKLTTSFSLLLLLVVLTTISEIIAHYMGKVYKNNLVIYHFFTPIHFVICCLIYYHLFSNKRIKQCMIYFCIAFVLFSFINVFKIQGIYKFPHYLLIIESISLVLTANMLNAEILRKSENKKLRELSEFWFNSAILIFYSASFIFWIFFEYLARTRPPLLHYLFILLWWLSLTMYIMFLRAFYLDIKQYAKNMSK